jgi:pyridoxal phosphate enzyme (YggS family)
VSTGVTTDVAANIEAVRERIASACARAGRSERDVTLIGVTKTIEPERVLAAVDAGLADLGENRVQEGSAKQTTLAGLGRHPTWHLIGHLQTNKARAAVEHFATIHSVDSTRLLDAIGSRAPEPYPIFIEVNVSGEASKEGITSAELAPLLEHAGEWEHLRVLGLMTVAPLNGSETELHRHFGDLRQLAETHNLQRLSMGMTNDFEIAIEEGATHVRVGRAIFGERA